jgi:hypothetical protein
VVVVRCVDMADAIVLGALFGLADIFKRVDD